MSGFVAVLWVPFLIGLVAGVYLISVERRRERRQAEYDAEQVRQITFGAAFQHVQVVIRASAFDYQRAMAESVARMTITIADAEDDKAMAVQALADYGTKLRDINDRERASR